MRPLIYAINLTLDGCCDHTKGIPDEELHKYHTKLLRESDTLVYGRKTYDLMVPFWPEMARQPGHDESVNDFAQAFVAIPEIVVFSKTLKLVEDPKVRVADQDLHEEITRLKDLDGKAMLTGGVDLPSQLIALDLVDEFCFVVQPVLVGEGRRLPAAAPDTQKLQLLETLSFKSGAVAVRYRRAR